LKLREWFCDIWNFFNTPKLSGGWLCCGQKLYFWIFGFADFLHRSDFRRNIETSAK
jgi:hypothetical protein